MFTTVGTSENFSVERMKTNFKFCSHQNDSSKVRGMQKDVLQGKVYVRSTNLWEGRMQRRGEMKGE